MHILHNRLPADAIATTIVALTTVLAACSGSGSSGAMTPPAVASASQTRPAQAAARSRFTEFAYVVSEYNSDVSAYSISSKGALTPVAGSPFSTGTAPWGIAIDPTGSFAYVTNNAGNSDSISAFRINATTGALTPVMGSPFAAGTYPLGVAIDPTGKFAYATNNGSNDVSAYTIGASSGALTQVKGSPFAAGSNPFYLAVDPMSKFVYVVNSQSDSLSAYRIRAHGGALTPAKGSPFATGVVPNGVVVDPTGKFVYVASNGYSTYVSGSVSAFTINQTSGALTPIAGSPFAAGLFTVYMTDDPKGKFAYAVNQGGNVSAYTINATSGALTPVTGSPFAAGPFPMTAAVDPSDSFAYVVNLTGNGGIGSISGYSINPQSGALTQVPGSPFSTGRYPLGIATCRRIHNVCKPPPL